MTTQMALETVVDESKCTNQIVLEEVTNKLSYNDQITLEKVTDKSIYDNEEDINTFKKIACSAFESDMTYEDVKNHTIGSENLYLFRSGEQIIGFGTTKKLKFGSENILYLDGVAVEKEYQKSGAFKLYLEHAQQNERYVVGRTQNPVIMGSCKNHITGNFYPSQDNTPFVIQNIAEFIAKDTLKMKEFNKQKMIGEKTYGKSLYKEIPNYKKNKDRIHEQINFSNGDCYIFVIDKVVNN
ncbi:GNAT family N-acetyltransferase [Candidatus Woesearchaeota archaeon]|jgi:hypothetical protein|nr:GNAT family N-acetyltransferase [Candidatus Woesearchaeota archaeon]MBT6520109.1 GNAT family N-acetyltransferase [Candidatus Woesearchaeota archaeon]MBT7366714.1 GNAT family N-acetyltransferase [Candidatus Woesearchaeota archaeon]